MTMKTTTKHFWAGAGWGLVATLAMSTGMMFVWVVGESVMPEPIPLALIVRVIARALHGGVMTPSMVVVSIPIHFAYGALWGGLLATSTRRVTWVTGAVMGLGLWLLMVVFFLPLAGRSVFDVATSPVMWLTTLVLHLIYGVTLGALVGRRVPVSDDLDPVENE